MTPFVTWDDSWLIGIYVIDAQHKNLVSILNELHQASSLGRGKEVMLPILNRLFRYTQAHFAAEERLMQENGYVDIVAHKHEHEVLTKKVLDFQRNCESGSVDLSVEVMQFLGTWLREHICGTDQKYVPTLHAHGVR